MSAQVQQLRVKTPTVLITDSYDLVHLIAREIMMSRKTFKQIAQGAGISAHTVSKVCYREVKNPQVRTQLALLTYFGFEVIVRRR